MSAPFTYRLSLPPLKGRAFTTPIDDDERNEAALMLDLPPEISLPGDPPVSDPDVTIDVDSGSLRLRPDDAALAEVVVVSARSRIVRTAVEFNPWLGREALGVVLAALRVYAGTEDAITVQLVGDRSRAVRTMWTAVTLYNCLAEEMDE